jgi:hypothetical protein
MYYLPITYMLTLFFKNRNKKLIDNKIYTDDC